jgi:hypothetical protein
LFTLPPALPSWLAAIPLLGPILILLTFPGIGLPANWLVYVSVGLVGLLFGVVFLLLVWLGTVRAITKGRYAKAHGTTLLLAILFIIPVFAIVAAPSTFYPAVFLLLPAFFWLMSYGSLGEVIAKYGPVAVLGEAVPGVGLAGPPPPPPPPMMAGPPMQPLPMPGPMAPPLHLCLRRQSPLALGCHNAPLAEETCTTLRITNAGTVKHATLAAVRKRSLAQSLQLFHITQVGSIK